MFKNKIYLVPKTQARLGPKALVFPLCSYYHISMKTLNLLTVVLCLTGLTAPAFAQKQIIKGTGKGLFEVSRTNRGTVQRFVFPQQTVENIRRGIAAGKLDRQVTEAVLKIPTTSVAPSIAPHSGAEISVHYLISGRPVEKEILSSMLEENKFYAPEINAGRAIRDQILNITVLEEEGQNALAADIQQNIKNHTLKVMLLKNLEEFDIYNMALDLTDYFCLDKSFEDAAFDYTLRHPHQMNLNMRRLMYNPLVDPAVKTRLKYFLEESSLLPEEYDLFRAAIRTAHLQYQQRLSTAKYSDIIQKQIAYYEDFAKRLDNFIVRNNGVRPKWNSANPQEQQLFEEYGTLAQYDFANQFNPILTYRKQLRIIWDTASAPKVLSQEQTIALYEDFVKTTHRIYPHTLRDVPSAQDVPFAQEELLWDSLDHWRTESESAIQPHLIRIVNTYL